MLLDIGVCCLARSAEPDEARVEALLLYQGMPKALLLEARLREALCSRGLRERGASWSTAETTGVKLSTGVCLEDFLVQDGSHFILQ